MTAWVRVVILSFVTVVTISIWTVLGFFYWVPLLARACGAYSAALIWSAITNTKANDASSFLDKAVEFYVTGFRRILDNLFHGNMTDSGYSVLREAGVTPNVEDSLAEKLPTIAAHTIFALLFWVSAVLVLSYVFSLWAFGDLKLIRDG